MLCNLLPLLLLKQKTSSFAGVIITTTTRGRSRAQNVNKGNNQLLAESTLMVKKLRKKRLYKPSASLEDCCG